MASNNHVLDQIERVRHAIECYFNELPADGVFYSVGPGRGGKALSLDDLYLFALWYNYQAEADFWAGQPEEAAYLCGAATGLLQSRGLLLERVPEENFGPAVIPAVSAKVVKLEPRHRRT